jgi:hypothetical protein
MCTMASPGIPGRELAGRVVKSELQSASGVQEKSQVVGARCGRRQRSPCYTLGCARPRGEHACKSAKRPMFSPTHPYAKAYHATVFEPHVSTSLAQRPRIQPLECLSAHLGMACMGPLSAPTPSVHRWFYPMFTLTISWACPCPSTGHTTSLSPRGAYRGPERRCSHPKTARSAYDRHKAEGNPLSGAQTT